MRTSHAEHAELLVRHLPAPWSHAQVFALLGSQLDVADPHGGGRASHADSALDFAH